MSGFMRVQVGGDLKSVHCLPSVSPDIYHELLDAPEVMNYLTDPETWGFGSLHALAIFKKNYTLPAHWSSWADFLGAFDELYEGEGFADQLDDAVTYDFFDTETGEAVGADCEHPVYAFHGC